VLGNAFRMELTKVFRRKMTWVLAGSLVVLVGGLYIALYAVAQAALSDPGTSAGTVEEIRRMLCWPEALPGLLGLTGGAGLGGLMLVVLAGAMTAQEYSWRTTHLWLSRGLPRTAYLLAKFASLVVAALLLVLMTVLVALPMTAWFTLQLTGSLSLADLRPAQMGLGILRTAYSILPYAGLAFLVAILTRSTATAIAAGLAYALVLENVLVQFLGLAGGIWAAVARCAPGSLAAAVMETNMRLVEVDVGSGVSTGFPDPWVAVGGLALYTGALLGLSLWVFRRQNLTG
jgi:ABC-type transport system involved in multi-copper enzyme maturation permease subunit